MQKARAKKPELNPGPFGEFKGLLDRTAIEQALARIGPSPLFGGFGRTECIGLAIGNHPVSSCPEQC